MDTRKSEIIGILFEIFAVTLYIIALYVVAVIMMR